MSTLENYDTEIKIEKPDHHYRTELPNIVFKLGLDLEAIAIYAYLKQTAGDTSTCYKSQNTICSDLNTSLNTYKKYRAQLEKPQPLLQGKKLINVHVRKKTDNSNETTLISIVDIWRENGDFYKKGDGNSNKVYSCAEREQLYVQNPVLSPEKSQKSYEQRGVSKFDRGGCQNLIGGVSKFDTKEEPFKKIPLNKNNVLPPLEVIRKKKEAPMPKQVQKKAPIPKQAPIPKPSPKPSPVQSPIPKKQSFVNSLDIEQKKAFDKLTKYKPQWGDAVKQEDICAWMLSLKFLPERVIEALRIYQQDCDDAMKRGDTIRSMGASIRGILNNPNRTLRNLDFELNKSFAERKAKEHNFFELTNNYVKMDLGLKREEVNFNLPHVSFIQTMESLSKEGFYHTEAMKEVHV